MLQDKNTKYIFQERKNRKKETRKTFALKTIQEIKKTPESATNNSQEGQTDTLHLISTSNFNHSFFIRYLGDSS